MLHLQHGEAIGGGDTCGFFAGINRRGKTGEDRRARFVCVVALAERGEPRGVFSASAEGELLDAPRGDGGFGYDPIFFFPTLGKTFAKISREEKNHHSHRGKVFRKAVDFLACAT